MHNIRKAAVLACLGMCSASAVASMSADQVPFHGFRGWWVDRWDYSTKSHIQTMMVRAQALGITDVFFQIRGEADAYYFYNKDANGNVVDVYAQGKGISASYDPLGIAVSEGQARGIKVHAWINAMPIWRGTSLPTNPDHAVYRNSDPSLPDPYSKLWIRDANNERMPQHSGYVDINPAHPETAEYLQSVVRVIASNYAVDGIHLDHMRLHTPITTSTPLPYPRDPYTVSLYQAETGLTPTMNEAAYKSWVVGKITNLVGTLRQTLHETRPGAQLTAAVRRDPAIALSESQQDWATWADLGHLDAAIHMIYRKGFGEGGENMDHDLHTNPNFSDLFRRNVTNALNLRTNVAVITGIGPYQQDNPATAYNNVMAQLTFARDHGSNGITLFDYGSLYNGTPAQTEALRAITDFFNANNIAPPITMITDFESGINNKGYFQRGVTFSGSNQNVAGGSADRVTEEYHSPTGSQKLVIFKTEGAESFVMRHVSGTPNAARPDSNLTLPSIGSIGFWLKTFTSDLQVAVAVDDFEDNSSSERGYFQNVINDGQWHKYEWFFNDHSHWNAWAGANRDGKVNTQAWLDSIFFIGTESTNIIYLDDVFHDPAAIAPTQWRPNGGGDWLTTLNWTGPVPDGVGATALLKRRAMSAATINVDSPITLGTLTFDNNTTYTVTGAPITMDASSGNAIIRVINRGSHVLDAPVVLNDPTDVYVDVGASLSMTGVVTGPSQVLTKTGAGVLTASDGSVGSLVVTAGTLDVNGALSTNMLNSVGNLRITGALTVNAVGGTARVAGLTIDPGGKLDLNDNDLLVDYNGPSPFDTLQALALQGYRAAPDPSATGIVSTTSQNSDGQTILVLLDNAMLGLTAWNGLSIDTTTIIGKYTYFGDVNLDGQVTGDDFALVVSNLGLTEGAHWIFGDMNFDGMVTGDDVAVVVANLGKGVGNPLMAQGAAVPEPAAIGALLGLALLRRRRSSSIAHTISAIPPGSGTSS